MAALKATAKVFLEKFTFPARVRDKSDGNLKYGTCFAFYSSEKRYLATSRSIADAQREGPQGSHIVVQMGGKWLSCKALCPSVEIFDTLGKQYGLAILELDGNCLAPAGAPLGSASGTSATFIAGFTSPKNKRAKLHITEGAVHQLSMTEFEVTACPQESWIGGPVLDTSGHVIGVITGTENERTVATMSEYLTYYSTLLGLEVPPFGG